MTGTPFVWDEVAQRYRGPGGRFVSRAAVRRALDSTLDNTSRRMSSLARELAAGKIDLDDWLVEMRATVKDVHLYSTAAARGGWDQMRPADFGRVGRIVRDQYVYLDRFAADIEAGYPLDGRFSTRVDMYMQSGRRTYYEEVDRSLDELGYDEERSVLNPADHCDDCVSEATIGWQKRGDMIPIGSRQCLSNCRCTKQYRNSASGHVMAA